MKGLSSIIIRLLGRIEVLFATSRPYAAHSITAEVTLFLIYS